VTLADVAAEKLVFLDESAAKTNMTRTHGRATRGERVVEHVPHGHWRTETMLCAVRTTGPFAAATLDGATDADSFRAYVTEVLCPGLRPEDVVVMDNLSAHKAQGVREAIEAAGARLVYLPPYSPDLNPIENMWSKVKALLRKAEARTREALAAAIDAALAAITSKDCRGFFKNCGYDAR